MKLLFVLLFLGIWLNQGNSQDWNNIQQTSLGITYDLPQAWYVGGLAPHKACDCVGATVNSSPEGAISMMIVVGKKQQKDLLEQPIWGYEFIPAKSASELIQLENMTFEKSTPTWKQSPKEIVLCFITKNHTSKQTYVLFFWGKLESIQHYGTAIERIVASFKPF